MDFLNILIIVAKYCAAFATIVTTVGLVLTKSPWIGKAFRRFRHYLWQKVIAAFLVEVAAFNKPMNDRLVRCETELSFNSGSSVKDQVLATAQWSMKMEREIIPDIQREMRANQKLLGDIHKIAVVVEDYVNPTGDSNDSQG